MPFLKNIYKHPYHLVDPSPWPILTAFSCLFLTVGLVKFFHGYSSTLLICVAIFSLFFSVFAWWRDVIREATFEGQHTQKVQSSLRLGMILFIISEIMFFFGFFWAFFHSSLSPSPEIGSVWPPIGIQTIAHTDIPLLNTIVLLTSGVTLTWSHHALINKNRLESYIGLIITILLAVFFSSLQLIEYFKATFTISDSVYGSIFFMSTGFHGFHVLVGTIFLIVCSFRLLNYHFTSEHHFGFEAAAWYWHFVDVVWLFLFVVIYWWGGK